MADPSFDVVSKVDRQEVDNALNQAAKELSTRFDFRGTGAKVAWTLLACFLPIAGGLIYLVSQGASPSDLRMTASRRRTAGIYE